MNPAEIERQTPTGADIQLTSAPYFARPRDVAVTLTAA